MQKLVVLAVVLVAMAAFALGASKGGKEAERASKRLRLKEKAVAIRGNNRKRVWEIIDQLADPENYDVQVKLSKIPR